MTEEVTAVLRDYEKAVNTGDAKLAFSLCSREPVVMAQGAPAMVGSEAVRGLYEGLFKTLRLQITFQIHEIVSMGGNLAYVRTTSSGTQEILAEHRVLKEGNNELFIFRREDGRWKIHRYLFAEASTPGTN
ncbi:MAG: nuclear transport factor 2 family protein [Rhodospirillales bacterium]|nr:nuclear transport factor 2 family protein [Acetobacter sp.]